MQRLCFLREEFDFLQCFKRAPPIIEYIFAHERCKFFTFYAYLNALLWNLPFKKIICRCYALSSTHLGELCEI